MKLYYTPGACSLADHIALAEAGLGYDLVKVDLRTKQVEGGGDYLAINPNGYVPALELDDGAVLTENIAVLAYIADRSATLMPPSGMQHFRALELLAFISTELHKNFKPFFNPAASAAEKDEAKAVLAGRFAFLGDKLGEQSFLTGDEPTVADCYLFVMLLWAEKNGLEPPAALPAFAARMKARPAVARALSEEGLG